MPSEYDNNLDQERRPEPNTLRIENEALRRGFTLIPNYVLRARGLSRDAKLLYGILLSYAWQSGSCFPGYETLMDDMQCAREAIAKYIKELREKGLIEVKRRGQGKTSIYTIKDLDTGQAVGQLGPDEAEPAFSQSQKFGNRTSRSSVSRLQGVRKPNEEKDTEEKDTEEKDDDDIRGALEVFGISPGQAQRLAETCPPALVLEKLDLVSYLVERRSSLVSRNPQGFLIKAIEENYLPENPKGYKTKSERAAQAQRRQEQDAELERARLDREQTIAAYKQHQQPKPILGTKLTTATSWEQTLATLQGQMTTANFNMWLKQTVLVDCRDGQALIAAPSTYVAEWLRARMVPIVKRALVDTLGQPVELQFTVAADLTPPGE